MSELTACRLKAYGVIFALALLWLLLAGCSTTTAPQVTHIAPVTGKQAANDVVVRSEGNITRIYIERKETK